MALLATALIGATAVGNYYALKQQAPEPVHGAQLSLGDGSRWNKAPTNAPDFDAFQQQRRGTGAHDMTLNRPLAVKRYANNILRPMRDIEKKVHFRRQVGPKAAAWLQHTLANALPPDPPFYGDSKAVAYNRRLVAERVPRIHKGLTIVDRSLHEFNAKPMPMYYNDGHPRR